jgi:hypothetical protein
MAVFAPRRVATESRTDVYEEVEASSLIAKLQGMNDPIVPEPSAVYPESAFEAAITEVVRALLDGIDHAVVPRFGLDIAVFRKSAEGSRVSLIEVKSFNGQRQGGFGFGNGRGEGPQVDLLLCNSDQMNIINKHIRWAFVNARLPDRSSRYALISSSQALSIVMGEVKKGKQNNFSVSRLAPHLTSWQVFCEELSNFLLN